MLADKKHYEPTLLTNTRQGIADRMLKFISRRFHDKLSPPNDSHRTAIVFKEEYLIVPHNFQ